MADTPAELPSLSTTSATATVASLVEQPANSTTSATATAASPSEQPTLSTGMMASPEEQPSLSATSATATVASLEEQPAISTTSATATAASPSEQPTLSTGMMASPEEQPAISATSATAMAASLSEQPTLSTGMMASPEEQPDNSVTSATATAASPSEQPSLSTTSATAMAALPEEQPAISTTSATATAASSSEQPSRSTEMVATLSEQSSLPTTSAAATAASPSKQPSLSTTSATETAVSPSVQPSPSIGMMATPSEQSSLPTTSATVTAAEPAKIILGKYILERKLGEGTYAKVYRGRSIKDNKSVALKVIEKAKIKESEASNIIREIQAMWRLDHPNILKIHEVLATKTKIYLVMDLAKGGDLHKKLSKRTDHRFPEPIARKYFEQLVSALYYCHQNGVAHRDIKPGNLLLDEEDNIKVSDFGLSFVSSFTNKKMVMKTYCGTPCFAAPEVMRRVKAGYGYDGAKADAWSCGVVLFVLLTGVYPFYSTNLSLMYTKMLKKEFKFYVPVSRPARALINRLLDPNPITRLGIDQLVDSDSHPEWLVKAPYYPRSVSVGDMATLFDEKSHNDSLNGSGSMNAFEIISMSSGLNLSGLFQGKNKGKREEKFTSKESRDAVMEKLLESGEKLGYKADTIEDYCVVLRKGRFVVQLVVLEVVSGLSVVEFKVVKGSELGKDQDELYWQELKSGLAHIVVPWGN